ncbi:MAG: lysine--tRNA ligase [Candidatus Marinimicrobia bacterium]|nr:lysine--tRNA ligase [Candidatus Neomarinimicrobiota bacterium]
MNNKIEKSLRQIIQFRNEKLNRIREMGVNPYPYKYDASHRSLEIINNYDELEGKSVSVAGRIVSMRRMGKASFFHIQDQEGKIQIYIKKDDVKEDDYKLFKLLDIGDYVGVKGSVFKTKTGEISVSTDTITLLSKSLRPLPGTKEKDGKTFHTFADKEQRYRQRYLDLIVNPKIKDVFIKRAKIIQSIRDFLDCQRFLEVETPVLQPLYGGAFAKPFTTRHETLDRELYLRISDELYLKRLIIGGFEKVYELSKVFRNEGMDRNHNPEFTMLEFYITYVDYVYLMDFTEKLIQSVAESVEVTDLEMNGHKIDLMQPFRRASYMDLLSEGVGEDISEADEEHLRKLCDSRGIELEKGTHLGKIYEVLMREFVEPDLMKPTFIIDYPIVISPLAKSRRDGNEKIVERFELFIGGCELANAFSELNDPLEQRKRFEQQVTLREAGDEEAQTLDEDFLRAVEIGMPPTGGVGIGIDRLTMLITERKTIKDVILFPAMRSLNKETEAPD